jgi:ribulose-5-phosphate 4-epimerase/fuculose-1-phosphate aldolase
MLYVLDFPIDAPNGGAMISNDQLRFRVAQACRVLGHLDLTNGTLGHVSARIPGSRRVFIRARGPNEVGVRHTGPEQIVEIDFDGKLVHENDKGLAAPIEVFIHTEVYKARPDVHSVVHVHPETVLLFTICDEPLLPLYGAFDVNGLQLAVEGVPTFDSSLLIDNATIGSKLARTLKDAPACLMRGHGITAAASNIEEAVLTVIALNDLARINYRARLLGKPRPIAKSEQKHLMATYKKPAPTNGEVPGGRLGALWRYYCALADK